MAFGVAAVASVYFGFIATPVARAEWLVRYGVYYVMAATFVLFLRALWRLWRTRRAPTEPLTRRQRALVLAAIALFSWLAINAEPYCSKILNDEFVLQSTAFNLHFFRDAGTMVRGYDLLGTFVSTDSYLDKRPFFYPFLVSLAHDLTGYRPLNAFLVNSLLMPVALALAFVFGRQLAGWRGGLLALLLLGSLPLLGQNATGSGMELLNVVMILATLALGVAYLAAPDENRLAALVLAAVLLGQSRYESALYAAPVAAIALAGWWRVRRVVLPAAAILTPLLLLPCAWQNLVLSNSPMLWQLTEETTTRFSFGYFAANARGALRFLFNSGPSLANSMLLSVVGIAGLLWLAGRLFRRGERPSPDRAAARASLLGGGLAIGVNTLLVFCYYWSNFEDPMASRFSLPLYLLFTFAAVILAVELDRRGRVAMGLSVAVVLATIGVTIPRYAFHYYSHLGIDEVEWQQRFVHSRPPGERLVITNKSSLPWLLEKTPAIQIERALRKTDRLEYQMQRPTFREILVIQSLRPASARGDHELVPEDRLPERFKLQPLVEKRFGTKIDRISRLVAIEPAADNTPENRVAELAR